MRSTQFTFDFSQFLQNIYVLSLPLSVCMDLNIQIYITKIRIFHNFFKFFFFLFKID